MARRVATNATEVLGGLVDRVTFHNSENGFCVLRVKARGQRDLITVIRHPAMISAGEFVQASGAWVNDRTPWRPIPRLVSQSDRADHSRGYREISRLRHDPRHRAGVCEEARARVRRERIRHYRARAWPPP